MWLQLAELQICTGLFMCVRGNSSIAASNGSFGKTFWHIYIKRKRIRKYQVIALVRCTKKQLCKQNNKEHGRFAQQKHENETHMKEPGNLRGRYSQRLAVSLATPVASQFWFLRRAALFSHEQPCSPTQVLFAHSGLDFRLEVYHLVG